MLVICQSKIDAKLCAIANIEIINILQTELSDPSHKVITTNQVESKLRHLLVKDGMLEEDLYSFYKKYLKNLIEENFKNVIFQKLPLANEPDHLCSDHL